MTISIFTYLGIASLSKDNKNTVQTVALPVNKKTIIIDARAWKARSTEHQMEMD